MKLPPGQDLKLSLENLSLGLRERYGPLEQFHICGRMPKAHSEINRHHHFKTNTHRNNYFRIERRFGIELLLMKVLSLVDFRCRLT